MKQKRPSASLLTHLREFLRERLFPELSGTISPLDSDNLCSLDCLSADAIFERSAVPYGQKIVLVAAPSQKSLLCAR
jgi:hypothetical protein